LKLLTGDRLDRDRYVLERFFAALGGNDDLFQADGRRRLGVAGVGGIDPASVRSERCQDCGGQFLISFQESLPEIYS
jgi:hypothetical protein